MFEIMIFWYVTPLSLADCWKRFRRIHCVHLDGRTVAVLPAVIFVKMHVTVH
jgi:hypothetical protein